MAAFLVRACPSRWWRISKPTFPSTTRINQITVNDYENFHLVNLEQVSALLRSGSPLSRPPVWLPARLSATPPGSCASRIARKRTRPKGKKRTPHGASVSLNLAALVCSEASRGPARLMLPGWPSTPFLVNFVHGSMGFRTVSRYSRSS